MSGNIGIVFNTGCLSVSFRWEISLIIEQIQVILMCAADSQQGVSFDLTKNN